MHEHVLSAKGKKLGRLASEAARLLMGKHLATFTRNKPSGVSVQINDAALLDMTEKKRLSPSHKRYSGYPGGLRIQTANEVIARKGYRELIVKAVSGMLPKNSLRKKMLEKLTVKE